MSAYLTHELILDLIGFQVVLLLVILGNLYALRKTRQHLPPVRFPHVSVLVPARNEAENIARCVNALLAQQYPLYEVIVLDDHSTDNTLAVLQTLQANQPRLRILASEPLPDGWLGKTWACTQLAAHTTSELLLFTDADTVHQPHALREFVTTLLGEQADLVTGFPRQEMHSWGERLLVPFFSWAFFSFTPLPLAHRLRLPFLSSAVGQIMLFRRSAYQSIGGHTIVRDHIAEDLSLARLVKAAGLRWRVTDAHDLVSSHMYSCGHHAFEGFSKNFFAAFGFRLLPYIFIFTWLAMMFLVPLAVVILTLAGLAPLAQPAALLVCIALSLLIWIIPLVQLGFSPTLALLYPVMLLAIELVAINSLRLTLTGKLLWKGRIIASPGWKWI